MADADHDNKIVENVLDLQRQCRLRLGELESALRGIDDDGIGSAASARLLAKEQENRSLLEQLRHSNRMLQVKIGIHSFSIETLNL